MDEAVFFYADTCPRCPAVLDEALIFFSEREVTLRVRKPTIQEMRVSGFGYPALFIPRGVFGLQKPHMLVGEYLMEGLAGLLP